MIFFFKRFFLFAYLIRKPIFFIPGLGGSILYHNKTKEEIWPPTISNFFKVKDNIRVDYEENKFISKYPLVVGNLCDCSSIEVSKKWIYWILGHKYFHTIISYFKGENNPICCVPYDFRIIGNEEYRKNLFEKMRREIENYKEKYSTKIILLSHSLGGLIVHFFLLEQTDEWKNKFIDKSISINCPYEGSIKILDILMNSKIDKPFLENIDYVENLSCLLWLIPNPYTSPNNIIYENSTDILYNKNITSLLPDFLNHRIDFHFSQYLKDIKIQNKIPTYIIYSSNISTKILLNSSIEGDGDGSIPLNSLVFPKEWENQSLVYFINIPNEEHTNILHSPLLLDILKKLI